MISTGRLPALDRMRGLVMILMAVDHAGAVFDAGHLVTDSAALYPPGTVLPVDRFLVRLATHLCAPTFLFLAGTSLALSIARQQRRGAGPRAIDGHLAVRGLLILLLDPTLVSLCWSVQQPRTIVLQVLYAIGASLLLMVPLRRLPARWLVAAALAFLALGEIPTMRVWAIQTWATPIPAALLLAPAYRPLGSWGVTLVYPALPWLAMLLLGWGFGRWRCAAPRTAAQVSWRLLGWGAGGLVVFAVVRAANGHGNMGLLREDASLVQWLHVSKYPPSLAFTGLTLGAMAVILAVLFRRTGSGPGTGGAAPAAPADTAGAPGWGAPEVFGRTALFFYVLHLPVLGLLGLASGLTGRAGLAAVGLATLATLAILYLPCRAYGRYKAARPAGWTRLL